MSRCTALLTLALLCAFVAQVSSVAIVQHHFDRCFGSYIETLLIPTSTCINATATNNGLAFNTGASYTVTCSASGATITSFSDNFCRVALPGDRRPNPHSFPLGNCSFGFTFLSCDSFNAVGGVFPQMAYSFADATCTGVGIGTPIVTNTLCENSDVNPNLSTLFTCASKTATSATVSTFNAINCNAPTPTSTAILASGTCGADPMMAGGGVKVDCGGGLPTTSMLVNSSGVEKIEVNAVMLVGAIVALMLVIL